MATTTLTTNLKLRLSSDLTTDSRYNLQRIDNLGSIFQVDTNQAAKVRSQTNITLQPNDPDIGGSGSGGTVQIGTSDQPISTFQVYADSVSLSSSFSLADQASGGDKNLNLGYKSDISGAVDTSDNRNLLFDLEGADRNIVLGGDLSIDDSLTFSLSGATSVALPTSGTLASDTNTLTLSNKTISASTNTISDIANVNISGSAAIDGTKISPDFGMQEVQTSGGFSSTSGVAFKFPNADGTSGQAVVTDGSGQLGFASIATTVLSEYHLLVGDSSGLQSAVDTNSVGDILVDETNGATIKSGVIVDADVNASAAISLSKLGTTTASRALQTSAGGAIEASSVTTTELGYVSGVTSAIQTQLNDLDTGKQDQDTDLDALAGLSTTGLITRTGAGSAVTRSLAAGSSKISVANGDGFLGNPTVDLGTVSTDDITEGTSLFFTDERAQDAIGTALTDSSTINFTYDDASNTITAATIDSAIDHDSLLNFVTNEHINHGSVSVVAAGDSGLSTSNNDLTSNIGLSVDIIGTTAEASVVGADYVLIHDTSAGALRACLLSNVFAELEKQAYKTNWTQADGSTKVITHSLGTTDVRVELYDTSSGDTIIPDSIVRNSVNQVTVTGGNLPATFDFRILISEV